MKIVNTRNRPLDIDAIAHQQRLVTSRKKVAAQSMPRIEADRVSAEKPLHAGVQICARSLYHKMKMVAQQTPRVNLPSAFERGGTQSGDQ